MKKRFSKWLIKVFKWEYSPFPEIKACVVAMAPHTSLWDFVWGKLYFVANGKKSYFLIKKEVFKFPLGPILKWMGGIPVDRTSPKGLAKDLPKLFKENPNLMITITPEGTRTKTTKWKKGFIYIAQAAKVPIVVGYIDFKKKKMGVIDIMSYEGNPDDIMKEFKRKFHGISGKFPEQFATGLEEEV